MKDRRRGGRGLRQSTAEFSNLKEHHAVFLLLVDNAN
jgi:hypothetical protein